MTIWIDTAGRPSNSAKALAEHPGFKRNLTYKYVKPNDIIVNWGSSTLPAVPPKGFALMLNTHADVAVAANKHSAFFKMGTEGVSIVPWTHLRGIAQVWADDGNTIVVRNKLTGHSGDGIIIIEKNQEVPQAPLYTKYVFKTKEFRVHVANGKVIDTQQKIRDPDREPINWKVRSHENGFIYVRNNVSVDVIRDNLSIDAIGALGLDFGAVDIVQDKHGVYYVLEVNTAPGLEGQTLDNYVKAFQTWQ